jgi:hypothetical protein
MNTKNIGLGFLILGLAIAFMPSILPSSIFGAAAILPPDSRGQAGYLYKVRNLVVTTGKPFSMEFWSCCWPHYNQASLLVRFVSADGKVLYYGSVKKWFDDQVESGSLAHGWGSVNEIPFETFAANNLFGKIVVTVEVSDCTGSGCNDFSVLTWSYGGVFEVWVDKEACILQVNEMVVAETFAAGRTLTKNDLRFPVKAFCSTLPILVTEAGVIVEQRLEDYALIDRSYITIPAGQTWTIFYIADVDPDVAVICQDGVYDANQSQCVVSPAIVFSCSGDAIFDPVQKVCVTQAETRIVCEYQDAVYDTQLQKCVKIIPAGQVEVVCPANSVAELENGVIKRCVFATTAAEQWVCLAGQLDTSVSPPVCNTNAETELTIVDLVMQKIIGRSDIITMVGIALIIIGGFLFVKGKR